MTTHAIIIAQSIAIILLTLLVFWLADYARAMRESRNAWRTHHRTLVGASDDGGGDWPYWREEARKER